MYTTKRRGGKVMRTTLDWVALALVLIGGINWGLVGLFSFDLVEAILGSIPVLARIVYVLIGLGALYMLYTATRK